MVGCRGARNAFEMHSDRTKRLVSYARMRLQLAIKINDQLRADYYLFDFFFLFIGDLPIQIMSYD